MLHNKAHISIYIVKFMSEFLLKHFKTYQIINLIPKNFLENAWNKQSSLNLNKNNPDISFNVIS